MNKSELRKVYLERRQTLSADDIAAKSKQIADRFFAAIDLTTVNFLDTFLPIQKFNEIDTALIYERVWAEFPTIRTVAPFTSFEAGGLEHRRFTTETRFIENRLGIREPADGEIVETADIDMVVVPLLCFDDAGNRVGYGKGFYDKFLGRCRADCVKVGLSLFSPVSKIRDIGEYDVPLNCCITAEEIFLFGNDRVTL